MEVQHVGYEFFQLSDVASHNFYKLLLSVFQFVAVAQFLHWSGNESQRGPQLVARVGVEKCLFLVQTTHPSSHLAGLSYRTPCQYDASYEYQDAYQAASEQLALCVIKSDGIVQFILYGHEVVPLVD